MSALRPDNTRGEPDAAEVAIVRVGQLHRRVAEHGIVDPRLYPLDLVPGVDASDIAVRALDGEGDLGSTSTGCDVALLAAAAFRNPCGVVEISMVRSSTRPLRLRRGCAPGAAPAGVAMFQALVPLTTWTTRCGTGVGGARLGSTTWRRSICTSAAGAW